MQSQNRFLDDLAKILNGAAGTMAGMGREAEAGFRERIREFAGGMDFVSREEFDAVKQMAAKAREEVETLKARLDAMDRKASPVTAATKAKKNADAAGLDPDAD